MRQRLVALSIAVLMAAAVVSSACKSSTSNNTNAGTPNNTNTGAGSSSPSPTAPPRSSGASTPTEAFNTFFSAVKNKDIAALRSVLPNEMLDDMAAEAKKKNKSLDDYYRDEVFPDLARGMPETTLETRNEKIDGNRATLEFMSKGEWRTARFAKEGDSWRLAA